MNARIMSTSTKEVGNVVHAVTQNINGQVTRCKVHGGWSLVFTSDAVTCGACLRKERR